MPLPDGNPAPPHWLAYFTSADLEASVARMEELDADPHGAFFGLFEGQVDP